MPDGGYHIHIHNAVFILQSFGRCTARMQQTFTAFNFCVNKVSGFVRNNRRSVQCYSEIRKNGVRWGLKSVFFLMEWMKASTYDEPWLRWAMAGFATEWGSQSFRERTTRLAQQDGVRSVAQSSLFGKICPFFLKNNVAAAWFVDLSPWLETNSHTLAPSR